MLDRLKNAWASLTCTSFALFGLAFHKAWVYISVPEFASDFLGIASMRVMFDLLCAIAALCFGLLALRASTKRMRRTLFPLAIALQMGSSALLLVSLIVPFAEPALGALSCTAGAFGVVSMALLWTDLYSSFNPARVALYYSGSIILGNILAFALESNLPPRLYVVTGMLPIVTAFCFRTSLKTREEEKLRETPRSRSVFVPWKAILFFAVYAFAYGVSLTVLPRGSVVSHLPIALPAIIVMASVLLDAKRFNFEIMYRLAFPLMVCGFLLIATIPGLDKSLISFLISASYSAAEILIVLIICSMSYRSAVSAFWLFGIMKTFQYFAKTLGMNAGIALETLHPESGINAIAVAVIILVVVGASMLLMSERSIFSNWGAAAKDTSSSDKSPFDHVIARIDGLSSIYALTQRETEVLYLMAKGKTVAGIGSDMFIAEGTVKAHIQHIYQKLDVHSRKELMDLLGAERE